MDNEIKAPEVEQGFSFRKSLGGFKKADVINFISEENRKFSEERATLQSKLDEEVAKAADSAKKSSELQLYYELLLKKKSDDLAQRDRDLEEATKKADAAAANEESLRAEAENSKRIADEASAKIGEYENMIAELKAKCEAYEAQIAKAKEDIEAKEAECAELGEKCRELEEKLSAAPEAAEPAEEIIKEAPVDEEVDEEDTPVTAREYARRDYFGAVEDSEKKPEEEDTEAVTDKAIKTIRAISDDVRNYIGGCVGEFDSCSKDITKSISKLLDEIAERCRLLDERIREERGNVTKKIEDNFGNFKNK